LGANPGCLPVGQQIGFEITKIVGINQPASPRSGRPYLTYSTSVKKSFALLALRGGGWHFARN
jgi:hypothetical protein